MIAIFFVPGMFGSTIEYALRAYSKELTPVTKSTCSPDGSMHNFSRQLHALSLSDIFKLSDQQYDNIEIITSIYPTDHSLTDIISTYQQFSNHSNNNILIHSPDPRSAELNMLFQYYKIAFGSHVKKGLGLYCHNNQECITNWNQTYTHWSQMQIWELREWLSLLYPNMVNAWIDSQYVVDNSFLKVQNNNILNDPYQSIMQIAEFCNLTMIEEDLNNFLDSWKPHQQYILDEFNCLDNILNQSIDHWKPLSLFGEAIVQQRLRANGYEIRCNGLNTFPTDLKSLYNLLEKC